MWFRKQQYPCQPVCLAPKRCRKAISLPSLQYLYIPLSGGVKIRSLDETEGWTQFLELEPDDPMAFVGHQMVSMAAWVADQERDADALGRGWRRQEPGARPWDAVVPSPRIRFSWPGG